MNFLPVFCTSALSFFLVTSLYKEKTKRLEDHVAELERALREKTALVEELQVRSLIRNEQIGVQMGKERKRL